jgi:hypothetical protein
VKPFLLSRPDEIPVNSPPGLDSEQYLRELNEVKSVGARTSTTRTADQTAAALFWTIQTNIPWYAAARAAVADRKLPLAESARVFAALSIAVHDSLVAGWHYKAAQPFWRPITAIRSAGQLNDPRFVADTEWEPLIVTPAHPDYVSGHCVASGGIGISNVIGKAQYRLHAGSAEG